MSIYVNHYKQISSKEKDKGNESYNSFNLIGQRESHITDERNIIGPSLLNKFGDQNCFLNVVIHAAYNINEIRKFFLEEEFRKDTRLNFYSEFQYIIEKYFKVMSKGYKSSDSIIDPSELRRELSELFQEEQKFQLNKMNDPVDLLIFLLNSFHSYATHAKSLKYELDKTCDPQCISHNVFWINLLEQFQCKCGATSEVLQYDYNYFMYEVYAVEILELAQKKQDYFKSFFRLLKENNSKTTLHCPEKCRLNQVNRNFFLLSNPSYLCFNLIWSGKNPLLVDICKLFTMLPLKLNNDEIFNITERNQSKTFELFGLICYWGAHYICFFKNDEGKTSWISYDDTVITKVDNWKEVILKCLKSHFHPTILFYRFVDEESNPYYSRNRIDESQVFTEEEFKKIIAYCKSIDEMNEKKRDYLSINNPGKRSVSSFKIASCNSENIHLMKSLNKQNREEIEENVQIKNKSISSNDDKNYFQIESNFNDKTNIIKESLLINQKDEKKENKTKMNIIEIKPAEDEWICQNEKCNNLNKIDSYKCLKCKGINENIYLLNLQKNEYETNLKNSLKRRNSVDPRLMQGCSSLTKSENNSYNKSINKSNNQDKSDENQIMQKNLRVINKEISPLIKHSDNNLIMCNICKTNNSELSKKCRNCDYLLTDIENKTASNFESDSNLKDKYNERLNKYININQDDQRIFDTIKHNSPKKQQHINFTGNISNQKEPWYCPYCRHFNKRVQYLCENCHRDRKNYIENNKNSNYLQLDNSLQMNPSEKYTSYNTKSTITPVKKTENVRFKESVKETEKRSLNNHQLGPNPNIERIFNLNSNSSVDNNYKPAINRDSNKKVINITNTSTAKSGDTIKKPQLLGNTYYYSNIQKK